MPTCILAIESSCDDTSCAVCVDGKILANEVATQHIHEQYGGVVPELASRSHLKNIVPVVDIALKKAQVELKDISAVAFTRGPGLMGSLLVGGMFAKSLAQSLDVPLIDVHHIQAHILAHFIDEPKPQFPFLCLTVSGGHTQLVVVKDYLEMEIIGQTIDDAVGEAFDKTAKMLGLPYPGGPLIDKYAQSGDVLKFPFSEPKIPELNFSFSGFKTQVLYFLQKQEKLNPNFIQENLADICASIQYNLIKILINKLKTASQQFSINEIAIAGGVAANSELRKQLQSTANQLNWKVYIPDFQYCTDNAGMIAITAYYKFLKKQFCAINIPIQPRLNF
ncbi:MAG: tRNA (adenosine(37)-N6)-threonylcarbamoyltransferase complex transferase subunit TsaD [Chitinophagales bacterium]|nr:tRNA (adenosine(37)-N6)-threonylcarbamoyltransferase complex transferase subunit TsaD [Chitinophagales bacterium]